MVGLVVALIIASAYPYCVLKLRFGPNLSVVSAFFGFIALVLILRAAGTNARKNNIVQTMGTSAGQTAFMRCQETPAGCRLFWFQNRQKGDE